MSSGEGDDRGFDVLEEAAEEGESRAPCFLACFFVETSAWGGRAGRGRCRFISLVASYVRGWQESENVERPLDSKAGQIIG